MLLAIGKPVVEVGVYYPIVSCWAGEDAREIEKRQTQIGRSLLEEQIDFDYLDDEAISRAEIKGGALAVGDCAYSTVIVPGVPVMPIDTLRRLAEFVKAGGSVVLYEPLPHMAARAADEPELVQLIASMASYVVKPADLDLALAMLPWTVKLAAHNANIRAIRRSFEDTELFFLSNESLTEEYALRLKLPVQGTVIAYEPDTGLTYEVPSAAGFARVTLLPTTTLAILCGNASDTLLSPAPTPPSASQDITGSWTLTPKTQWGFREGEIIMLKADERGKKDPEALLGNPKAFDQLESWDTIYFPNFCGTVEYAISFSIPSLPVKAVLDFGVVGVVAEIVVNENPLGKRLWAPYAIDVTPALVAGTNTVRVMVTSTLHRLMTMPEIVGEMKQRRWLNSYAQKVSGYKGDPAPAGLLGPVKLLTWA
jgi:hypothetical protein